ncbi:pilin [Suttonella ornithocola]|uniref:Uncharacterized protein n=1 Tax=Suttonella ornithocola TaxID=279832 RepID=A0A380MMU8_9GAMM|nr:pilin [Suttonella ornithocola]SUO93955.1 Uncharacterised protein [Suttonella ornithocola]
MVNKHNYYHILGLTPRATMRQIIDAIEKIRNLDRQGDYTMILSQIEQELTNPRRRAAYDKANGFNKDDYENSELPVVSPIKDVFVDIDESFYSDPKSSLFQLENLKNIQEELQNNSALKHEPSKLKSALSTNFKYLILFILLIAIGFLAMQFSQSVMDYYNGRKSVEQAMVSLTDAQKTVENYIRNNGYFPETLNIPTGNDEPYQITVNGKNDKNQIILEFNHNAVSPLRNHALTETLITRPNFTGWQCDPSKDFPERYKPKKCF